MPSSNAPTRLPQPRNLGALRHPQQPFQCTAHVFGDLARLLGPHHGLVVDAQQPGRLRPALLPHQLPQEAVQPQPPQLLCIRAAVSLAFRLLPIRHALMGNLIINRLPVGLGIVNRVLVHGSASIASDGPVGGPSCRTLFLRR